MSAKRRRAARRRVKPPVSAFVSLMRSVGIVCGGVIAAATVAGFAWNFITAPVRAEAAIRAQSDSLLTDVISGVAGEVAKLKAQR